MSTFKEYWNLNSKKFNIRCGVCYFYAFEISKFIPNIKIKGIDISEYAIENSQPEIKKNLQIASADNLPFSTLNLI